jgi:hypothetical protein
MRAGPDPDPKQPHSERSRKTSNRMMSGSSGWQAGSPTRQRLLRYLTFFAAAPKGVSLVPLSAVSKCKKERMAQLPAWSVP